MVEHQPLIPGISNGQRFPRGIERETCWFVQAREIRKLAAAVWQGGDEIRLSKHGGS